MQTQLIFRACVPFLLTASVLIEPAVLRADADADAGVSRLIDVARPTTRPAAAPKYSDVCLSSRWKRPVNNADPHDSLKAIEAFHATRLEWAYIYDREFIEKIKARGLTFSPAVNTMTFTGKLAQEQKLGRIVDRRGNVVSAPWMRMWKRPGWGCVNSPDYRESYLNRLKQLVDLGADTIQVDDPGCNWTATHWGACFCEHCMKGFTAYLEDKLGDSSPDELGIDDLDTFSYAEHLEATDAPIGDGFRSWDGGKLQAHFVDFQRSSLERFYRDLWKELAAHAGRRVPMTTNNGSGHWTFPFYRFDYGVSELSHHNAHPDRIRRMLNEAAARGKAQVFTLVSRDVAMNRRVIAACYANGGHMIVPWDVYLKSTPEGSERYFGKPEEYADLYGFVRKNADYFDGYEAASALGPHIEDERFETNPPITVTGGAGIYAFARVKPGQPEQPVVIHLMHMDGRPQSFKVTWRQKALFGDRPVRAEFRRPGAAPRDLDIQTDATQASVEVEQLPLWGLLIVQPDAGE